MHLILLAMTLVAFGGKKEKAEEATPPEPAVEAPAPEPEPLVEPPPAPPPAKNADFNVSLTRANGETISGHVFRIERGEDIYGDKGWTDEEKNRKFYVEGNGEYKKIAWTDVSRISIRVKDSKDHSCVYSSDYSPWMYECSVKLTPTLTTKDGKSYSADSGYKWRFFLDGGKEVEFWLKKHCARQQDDNVVDLNTVTPENYDLYTALQQQLRTDLGNTLVVSVQIQ